MPYIISIFFMFLFQRLDFWYQNFNPADGPVQITTCSCTFQLAKTFFEKRFKSNFSMFLFQLLDFSYRNFKPTDGPVQITTCTCAFQLASFLSFNFEFACFLSFNSQSAFQLARNSTSLFFWPSFNFRDSYIEISNQMMAHRNMHLRFSISFFSIFQFSTALFN